MNMQLSHNVPAPAAPAKLEDLGLSAPMVLNILLKTIYRKNLTEVGEISKAICLSRTITQDLVDMLRGQNKIEAMGTLNAGATSNEMAFQLTDAGRTQVMDALSQSEYFGPIPVALEDYRVQVDRQSIRNAVLSRYDLSNAMRHLVIPPDLIDNLGPAITSGRSMLMYGPPGNGKSSISNGIRDAIGDKVFVPHAIAYAGQVITVYDPIIHTAAQENTEGSGLRKTRGHDPRYVYCDRPNVTTGGELTLDMLGMGFNPTARTYTAPLQLKSNGGIFIIDDLGRQADSPQSIINRWIVPLEANKDILALQSGEKFEVPFDTLVIFSTNFHPNEIFDAAALRRIYYKVKVDGPSKQDFLKIFGLVAKAKGLPLDEQSLIHLINVKYREIDFNFANYQPAFLIDQIIMICKFEGMPYQMTPELVDRTWANMFMEYEEILK